MEHFTLKTETLNAILGYLGTRPYQEVSRIITAIYAETNPQLAAAQSAAPQPLEVVEGGSNASEKA